MDEFSRAAARELRARRHGRRRVFWLHVIVWLAVSLLLVVVWAATGASFPWFVFPVFGWFVAVAAHGAAVYVLSSSDDLLVRDELGRSGDG